MTDGEGQRAAPRYAARARLPARFGDTAVNLINLSIAGAMIRHVEPIPLGTEAPLKIERSGVELHAEIIWSRTTPGSRDQEYASGLRFTEWIEVAQWAIDELVSSGHVRLDSSAPPSRLRGGE